MTLKLIYFTLTIFTLLVVILLLDTIDTIQLFYVVLFIVPIIGYLYYKKPATRNIGWGILYGSLTTIVFICIFIVWFVYSWTR